jgi:uncharacterized protein YndB with AHSA1/START domain
MARQSVSKHLAVLEAAGLVSTVWQGRQKLHYLDPSQIGEISDRWINQYDRARVLALTDLKRALEEDPVALVRLQHLHPHHPRALWQALTEPAFTQRYWGLEFEADWQPGSPLTLHQWGLTGAHPEQVVLESEPYRRLSYAWHTFTPEWQEQAHEKVGFDEAFLERIAAEPRSNATFEIDDLGGLVKLTVIHDGFEPGSEVLPTISQGWPHIVSNLKTLLETGEVLPAPAARASS